MTSYVMTKEKVSRKIADEAARLYIGGVPYEEAVRMAKENDKTERDKED